MNTKQLDDNYILHTYARADVALQQGSGCRCTDENGKSYLDFASGIGTNSLGWCNEAWLIAVCAQAGKLQHTSNLYYTQPAALLAQQLCIKTGMKKVFFANSGAEANEGAIKAARKYSHMKYGEERYTIVTLENSFHGRTMATLSATGQAAFHQHFDPFLQGFEHIEANNCTQLEAALNNKGVCALMLEVIQGEGGVIELDEEYLKLAQALCEQNDVLLIADEVQTGAGRTGHFLACEATGIKPDIITMAKGLGGGLPIGAFLLGEKCENALQAGEHGSTYGGNPVCCAGALEVVKHMDEAFLSSVKEKGDYFKALLKNVPQLGSISGKGLMLGAELLNGLQAADIVKKAGQAGLLCLSAKDKLRFLPPLIITKEEINEGVGILKAVLEEMVNEAFIETE